MKATLETRFPLGGYDNDTRRVIANEIINQQSNDLVTVGVAMGAKATVELAEHRAVKMMAVKIKDLPPRALAYARFLGRRHGLECAEGYLTAYAGYCQKVEHLPCNDSLYLVNESDWEAFCQEERLKQAADAATSKEGK